LLSVLIGPSASVPTYLNEQATAQYDLSYCQGKRDEMGSRANEWMMEWSTAESDPGGQIRNDGKQLTSEIGLTLVNCDILDDSDKLTLTQMKDVIDASIDENIDFGPPCTPNCQPGPPVS
jgi:hypothetical protein